MKKYEEFISEKININTIKNMISKLSGSIPLINSEYKKWI